MTSSTKKKKKGSRGEALHEQRRIDARTLPTFLLFQVPFAFFSPQTTPNAEEAINIDAHAEHTERNHKLLPFAMDDCFRRQLITAKWFREPVRGKSEHMAVEEYTFRWKYFDLKCYLTVASIFFFRIWFQKRQENRVLLTSWQHILAIGRIITQSCREPTRHYLETSWSDA